MQIHIDQSDAIVAPVDVLVVKYAQQRFGLDKTIAGRLSVVGADERTITPGPGSVVLVPSRGVVAAPVIAFVGTVDYAAFDYKDVYRLAQDAINAIQKQMPLAKSVGITAHGPGFGLDELESMRWMLNGIASTSAKFTKITIFERDPKRYSQFQRLLPEALSRTTESFGSSRVIDLNSDTRSVFVAMPFAQEFQDVYELGIGTALRETGFHPERVDQTHFIGNIVERIRNRIEKSKFVVADVTDSNPNVYLEIGFAWGKGRDVITVARSGTELYFNIRQDNCIFYTSVADLKNRLSQALIHVARRQ